MNTAQRIKEVFKHYAYRIDIDDAERCYSCLQLMSGEMAHNHNDKTYHPKCCPKCRREAA